MNKILFQFLTVLLVTVSGPASLAAPVKRQAPQSYRLESIAKNGAQTYVEVPVLSLLECENILQRAASGTAVIEEALAGLQSINEFAVKKSSCLRAVLENWEIAFPDERERYNERLPRKGKYQLFREALVAPLVCFNPHAGEPAKHLIYAKAHPECEEKWLDEAKRKEIQKNIEHLEREAELLVNASNLVLGHLLMEVSKPYNDALTKAACYVPAGAGHEDRKTAMASRCAGDWSTEEEYLTANKTFPAIQASLSAKRSEHEKLIEAYNSWGRDHYAGGTSRS